MANAITIFRMAASIVLLFCPAFSPVFYVFYIMAGLSDMLDGFAARKTNTASRFGARLDTIADYMFVIVCLIKLLPVILIAADDSCFPAEILCHCRLCCSNLRRNSGRPSDQDRRTHW